MKEIIEKRTLCNKVYDNENGTHTVVISGNPVHYEEDGQFKDCVFDIRPEQNWETGYTNKTNNFHVYFVDESDSENSTLASYEIRNSRGDYRWANYKLIGASPLDKIIDVGSVTYVDCFTGVDLKYEITSVKLKEKIILKDIFDNFSCSFSIKMDENLVLIKMESGEIEVRDLETGETLFVLEKPFAEDAVGRRTELVRYDLDVVNYKGNKYDCVTLTVDDTEFLTGATYPVIIDPTTVTKTITSALNTGYLSMTSTDDTNWAIGNWDSGEIYLRDSYSSGLYSKNYVGLSFNTTGAVPAGRIITDAELKLTPSARLHSNSYSSIWILSGNKNGIILNHSNIASTTQKAAFPIVDSLDNQFIVNHDVDVEEVYTLNVNNLVIDSAGWTDFILAPKIMSGTISAENYVKFYDYGATNPPKLGITYNSAPSAPGAFVSPVLNSILDATQTVTFQWGASSDLEGDTITYDLYISVDGGTTYPYSYTGLTSNVNSIDLSTVAQSKICIARVRAKDTSADSGTQYSDYTYSQEFKILRSSLKAKIGSVWRFITDVYTKIAGSWRKVECIYRKVDGKWIVAFHSLATLIRGNVQQVSSTSIVYKYTAKLGDGRVVIISTYNNALHGIVATIGADDTISYATRVTLKNLATVIQPPDIIPIGTNQFLLIYSNKSLANTNAALYTVEADGGMSLVTETVIIPVECSRPKSVIVSENVGTYKIIVTTTTALVLRAVGLSVTSTSISSGTPSEFKYESSPGVYIDAGYVNPVCKYATDKALLVITDFNQDLQQYRIITLNADLSLNLGTAKSIGSLTNTVPRVIFKDPNRDKFIVLCSNYTVIFVTVVQGGTDTITVITQVPMRTYPWYMIPLTENLAVKISGVTNMYANLCYIDMNNNIFIQGDDTPSFSIVKDLTEFLSGTVANLGAELISNDRILITVGTSYLGCVIIKVNR